ncbi:MAG: hypothetical protein XD81_0798 [Bacteroidetes bacterium 38_7]|nr:MAG: hypothetical protein XD81_0798 [Bacteroidetes bacterium 38_7]
MGSVCPEWGQYAPEYPGIVRFWIFRMRSLKIACVKTMARLYRLIEKILLLLQVK